MTGTDTRWHHLAKKEIIYNNADSRASWAPHSLDAWLLGPSKVHYRCQLYYVPELVGFQFSWGLPPHVPLVIPSLGKPAPSHWRSSHAPASVASMLALTAPPLCPLVHEDLSSSSDLDLTMSFWPSTSAAGAPPVVPPVFPPPPTSAAGAPPVVPPVVHRPPVVAPAPPVTNVDRQAPANNPPSPALVSMIFPTKPFKLPPIADSKAYLNLSSIIQYYLHRHEFSAQRSDGALITNSRNAEASADWEGQVRVAVQDGSLRFLFENKSSVYHRKGFEFEMLGMLNEHCHPDSVANTFTTRMSLLDDNIGELGEFMAFWSRFDGMVNDMAHCEILIPLILIIMFFLRSPPPSLC